MTFVSLSATFVFIYLWFSLRSFWLSANAILNIALAYPIALCLYKGPFRVPYYQVLHYFLAFIVFGLAVNGCHIFSDAWRQSGKYASINEDRVKRMSFTWRRGAKSMFTTSIIVTLASIANVFSLLPIASFGIFAATIVPVNFFLVICIYPAHIIIHDRYFNGIYTYIGKFISCKVIKEVRVARD